MKSQGKAGDAAGFASSSSPSQSSATEELNEEAAEKELTGESLAHRFLHFFDYKAVASQQYNCSNITSKGNSNFKVKKP